MKTTPLAQSVAHVARIWAARHPDLAARIERAVALVANVDEEGPFGPGTFFVEGSHGARYMVRVDRKARVSECTCMDSIKGNHCKHRIACALFLSA